MPETLTRGEAQVVFTDLKAEIDNIRNQIKSKGVLGGAIDTLQSKQNVLQDYLNTLLKKGGLITEEDYNKAYIIMKANKKEELDSLQKQGNKRIMLVGGIILVGVIAYFIYKKYKK